MISTRTINEKLLHAYRDVLIYLNSDILNSKKFSYTDQQIINFCQHILFFIQTNPNLKRLLSHIPQLIYLIQTKQFNSDEQQQYHQSFQNYSSIQSQVQPLKSFSSEGTHMSVLNQQLTRLDINDSGIDVYESSRENKTQNFSSPHHTFIGKTASSPIPEHGTLNVPVRAPLRGVVSAPSPASYSDHRHQNSTYQHGKHRSILAKSDEDEQESQNQEDDSIYENKNPTDTSKPLGQFYSLRYRNVKPNQNAENVSQYLGVDTNSAPGRNTFLQPNTGMRGKFNSKYFS